MSTIYKSSKGGIDFFTPKAAEPPKKDLDSLTAVRHLFTDEEFEAKVALLNGRADSGDPIPNTFENLASISARVDLLAPLATDSRNAQVAMAVTMLNEKVSDLDAHLDLVKKATGANWPKIRLWCDVPAEGGAGKTKTGATRVPTDVLRAIDAKVQQGKDEAAARKAKAAANRASA